MSGPDTPLYTSPGLGEQIANPTIPLTIVEGEKKALAGVQAGFCCMAIGGIGTFVQKGKPIPDVDILPRGPRRVERVPEREVWARPDLMLAVYAFGRILEDRGAEVAVVILVPAAQESKRGLDYPNTSLSAHVGAPRQGAHSEPVRAACPPRQAG